MDDNGVNKGGEPGGHLSVFTDKQPAGLRLLSTFKKDCRAKKVYLAGREYYGEDGNTYELRLIGKIKQQLNSDPTFRPEYPSPLGLRDFTLKAAEVTLGRNSRAILEREVLGVQTPGFSAAVRLGAELLQHLNPSSGAWSGPVYLSSPCDDSLGAIFKAAGVKDIRHYSYWDDTQRGVSLEKLQGDLDEAPERSVVVLSASAHYPTGADLCQSQWAVIAQLITKRKLFPFLLLPAQALASGNLEQDAWAVQYCASEGMELLCAQSFSHCFGLYGEAVGHLLCISKHKSLLQSMHSHADQIVRSLWAEPSSGGAHIAATVFNNSAHFIEWQEEVKHMVERCLLIRAVLREKLRLLGTPGCWDHLTEQHGLFCCVGLNDQQVESLSSRKQVYMLSSGCLNVSAINGCNLDYIAESIHQVLTTQL